MKKIICLILALIMCISLVSCDWNSFNLDDVLGWLESKPEQEESKSDEPEGETNESFDGARVINVNGFTGETIEKTGVPGKITVFYFWGIWCSGCVSSLPDYDRIANDYSSSDVAVVAVHTSIDSEFLPDWIDEYYSDSDNLIFAVDSLKEGTQLDNFYHDMGFASVGYPTTAILDADGNVVYRYYSLVTYDQLKLDLDSLISK